MTSDLDRVDTYSGSISFLGWRARDDIVAVFTVIFVGIEFVFLLVVNIANVLGGSWCADELRVNG